MRVAGQLQILEHALTERFQRALVLFSEGGRTGRKDFEYSDQIIISQERKNHHRAHAQPARSFHVSARVRLGIVAALHLASLDARARQASLGVEPRAQLRGIGARAGAAY
jgi:hypothetical protein